MKKVLIVLTAEGISDAAIEYAVERAKKAHAGVVALYLLEAGRAKDAFDTFSDMGFIGGKPSEGVSESLMKDLRQRGYEEIGRVQIKAMEEGVDFDPLMEEVEEKDPVSKVLGVIRSKDVSAAVVSKKKKRFMKYFHKPLADEIREKAPNGCEVYIFEEE